MKKLYTAITGDLIKSREIPNRNRIQLKLQNILDRVNKQFKDIIIVKFSITVGDEFQGLLNSVEKSYDIIKEIQNSLYPVKISFGVGVGSISTKIMKKSTEMDGECFRWSREALEKAKKDEQSIVYITGNSEKDLAMNTIIMLMDAIKNDWKTIHYKRTSLYEKFGTFDKVAVKEGITKQMISKMFADIKYKKIKKTEETVRKLLSTL
ncbi:MAG: SatD family protein [Elusimicrobiota bacterium]|nr:SatD family protein [Elusimicrobiota bacterium]